MPHVLWGVACISLPGPARAGDVVREFRKALPPPCGQGQGEEARVDLYRLVPVAEEAAGWLAGEERLVAHVPDAGLGCAELEEICRQRDEAEMRYDRVRESLVAMMDSIDFREEGAGQGLGTPRCRSGALVHSVRQELLQILNQENQALRNKLVQNEVLLREQEQTAAMLQREFRLLVHEVMLFSSPGPQQTLLGAPGPQAAQVAPAEGPAAAAPASAGEVQAPAARRWWAAGRATSLSRQGAAASRCGCPTS